MCEWKIYQTFSTILQQNLQENATLNGFWDLADLVNKQFFIFFKFLQSSFQKDIIHHVSKKSYGEIQQVLHSWCAGSRDPWLIDIFDTSSAKNKKFIPKISFGKDMPIYVIHFIQRRSYEYYRGQICCGCYSWSDCKCICHALGGRDQWDSSVMHIR